MEPHGRSRGRRPRSRRRIPLLRAEPHPHRTASKCRLLSRSSRCSIALNLATVRRPHIPNYLGHQEGKSASWSSGSSRFYGPAYEDRGRTRSKSNHCPVECLGSLVGVGDSRRHASLASENLTAETLLNSMLVAYRKKRCRVKRVRKGVSVRMNRLSIRQRVESCGLRDNSA